MTTSAYPSFPDPSNSERPASPYQLLQEASEKLELEAQAARDGDRLRRLARSLELIGVLLQERKDQARRRASRKAAA
jgi:hypothetical protein